jgi:hypothetical protein
MYAIICFDKPGRPDAQDARRAAHLEYIRAHSERNVIAGPLSAEDDSHSNGSLLVMDFEDRAAAEAFAARDPFNAAGVFESVIAPPFRKAVPEE